jgi:hypothetical protein
MASGRRPVVDKRLMERPKRELSFVEYKRMLAKLPDIRWKAVRVLPPSVRHDFPRPGDVEVRLERVGTIREPHILGLEVRIVSRGRFDSAFDAFRVMLESPRFLIRTRQGQVGVRLGEASIFELEPLSSEELPLTLAGRPDRETLALRVFAGSSPVLDCDVTIELAPLSASRY